ncbi:hypothetical protein EDB84DRAFT_1439560 [Lactarius hengduanensis]|nr:hypothetical protein EDB84DRAFT_1439560 [Lactarius hengduanensis]
MSAKLSLESQTLPRTRQWTDDRSGGVQGAYCPSHDGSEWCNGQCTPVSVLFGCSMIEECLGPMGSFANSSTVQKNDYPGLGAWTYVFNWTLSASNLFVELADSVMGAGRSMPCLRVTHGGSPRTTVWLDMGPLTPRGFSDHGQPIFMPPLYMFLMLRIPEYGSEVMEVTRVGFAIDVWSLTVDAKVDYAGAAAKPHTSFLGLTRVPDGCPQGARKVGRCDEHKGEADWCAVDLTVIKHTQPHGYYTRTLLGATPDDLEHESTIKLQLCPFCARHYEAIIDP